MRAKLFAFYFLASFSSASLGYMLVRPASGQGVFGALFGMFLYHRQHPFQYIAIACLVFAAVAAFFTPRIAPLTGWRRVLAVVGVMLGSIVFVSIPGGVLWSIHDMQAGYFPPAERFWRALGWGASTRFQVGWLVVALSPPLRGLDEVTPFSRSECIDAAALKTRSPQSAAILGCSNGQL